MYRRLLLNNESIPGLYSVIISACFLLVAIFLLRAIGSLSPSNDEAIYIVVGNYGVFHYDWWSLNPATWVGGFVRMYPAFTALAYQIGGIAGSRTLSSIFALIFLEASMLIAISLSKGSNLQKYLSGALTFITILASQSFWIVGRLATLDCMSFSLLFLGILFLRKATTERHVDGKWYFAASISLLLSILTKYTTALYIPFLLLLLIEPIKTPGPKRFFFIRYFLAPLLITSLLYVIANKDQLFEFFTTQVSGHGATYRELLAAIWDHIGYLTVWTIPAAATLLITKRQNLALWLLSCGIVILAVHLAATRLEAFEKQVLLSVGFLSILCGVGISRCIFATRIPALRVTILIIYISSIVFFTLSAYQKSTSPGWDDTSEVEQFIKNRIAPSDRVLTETGAAIMLALYQTIDPANVTTFDWFSYSNSFDAHPLEGDLAYEKAVIDGYFRFLEISKTETMPDKVRIHQIVMNNIVPHYHKVFENNAQIVYERVYE